MTLLVASITADTLEELQSRAERAWAGGAEAIELRIDAFDDDPAQLATYLKHHRDRTWIITCRSADEGGRCRGGTMQRVLRLIAAARGTGAYVDFEFADWLRSSDVRENIRKASANIDNTQHRLILSTHDFEGVPGSPATLLDEIAGANEASSAKVAYNAKHICDTFHALDLARRGGMKVSAIAMGEAGLWTRVLAKKLGAFSTYCALDAESTTAPGQLTLDDMLNRYRWPMLDASTKVFGVIGDPVRQSMSPLLMNRWFAEAGINAVYLPLRVAGEAERVSQFLDGCRAREWLDIGGFSVTVPHKTAALRWAGNGADSMAESIGALNTLVFRNGRVIGCNTDCYAAISSMTEALGCSRGDLARLSIDVLGTGGAARAVLHGLHELGCQVTVYGRSQDKTLLLADEHCSVAAAWENRASRAGEVVINCTSVGMWPDVDDSPMPTSALCGSRLVFDLIYNPLETRLLKDAAGVGAIALSGLDMFVRQAAMQFALWTGTTPDTGHTHDVISREIERRARPQP